MFKLEWVVSNKNIPRWKITNGAKEYNGYFDVRKEIHLRLNKEDYEDYSESLSFENGKTKRLKEFLIKKCEEILRQKFALAEAEYNQHKGRTINENTILQYVVGLVYLETHVFNNEV